MSPFFANCVIESNKPNSGLKMEIETVGNYVNSYAYARFCKFIRSIIVDFVNFIVVRKLFFAT